MTIHFDHEKFTVYQRAIEFVELTDFTVTRLPDGRAYISDQLKRASSSIVLNIAEGAGEFSANDKKRFYRMARRSATECAAIIDICARLNLIKQDEKNKARELLIHIVRMLTTMVKPTTELSSTSTPNSNSSIKTIK